MKKQIWLSGLLFLSMSSAFAQLSVLQELAITPPVFQHSQEEWNRQSSTGISLVETLNHTFDSITALTPIKGFNAAMLLPDGSIWERAKGAATELPFVTPLTTGHVMGMGSISKSFVAATLLLLYEDGLLDLGDSIGTYVGPYPNVPGSVTIRQLLSHRSGISDYLNENPAMGNAFLSHMDSIWEPDSILHHYVLSPNFPVGTGWSYSNTNYLLAGRIIERITGRNWYEVVRERLIDPHGLTQTFIYPWESPGNEPFAHVWVDVDGNGTVDDWQGIGLPMDGLFSLASSAGCLVSNPKDLARFSERLYGGHILQPATLAEMQTDYLPQGSNSAYGLGAASFVMPQQLENWGHNGDLLYKSFAPLFSY